MKGDEHPAYTPVGVWHTLALSTSLGRFLIIFICHNMAAPVQCTTDNKQTKTRIKWGKTEKNVKQEIAQIFKNLTK